LRIKQKLVTQQDIKAKLNIQRVENMLVYKEGGGKDMTERIGTAYKLQKN